MARRRHSAADRWERRRAKEGDTFAVEKRGISMGVIGGIVMMGIAAVWFFVGLASGVVFLYPPVLFVIGVFAVLKGFLTGNLAGGRTRPHRKRRRRKRSPDAGDLPDADDPRFAASPDSPESTDE
ncbi:MAG: hypothetical protein ACYSU0_09330 [Planctomycetota bacterium]